LQKIKNITLARLATLDSSTVAKWSDRPIFQLLRTYFDDNEIVQFLKNRKIDRLEMFNSFDFDQYYQFYFKYFSKNPLNSDLLALYFAYLLFLKKTDNKFDMVPSPFITSFSFFINNKSENGKNIQALLKILKEFEDKNLYIPLRMALSDDLKIIYQNKKGLKSQNHHQLFLDYLTSMS